VIFRVYVNLPGDIDISEYPIKIIKSQPEETDSTPSCWNPGAAPENLPCSKANPTMLLDGE